MRLENSGTYPREQFERVLSRRPFYASSSILTSSSANIFLENSPTDGIVVASELVVVVSTYAYSPVANSALVRIFYGSTYLDPMYIYHIAPGFARSKYGCNAILPNSTGIYLRVVNESIYVSITVSVSGALIAYSEV